MAKFYGKIGYAVRMEIRPGVWDDEITEREYFGDLVRNTSRYQTSDKLNDDINISNEISIVADPFAYQNFHAMRYVEFMGAKWKISSVEVQNSDFFLFFDFHPCENNCVKKCLQPAPDAIDELSPLPYNLLTQQYIAGDFVRMAGVV